MSQDEHPARLTLARRLARQAGELTLKYFGSSTLEVERKGDGSPLTIADQETERWLRNEISNAFPADGIVGEEFGESTGASGVRWILDPIDGTKSFISGVPLFGTMVAVEDQGEAVIGSISIPALNEGIYAARGQGAWHWTGDLEPVRAKVSTKRELSECVLVTSEIETFFERGAGQTYRELADQVFLCRTWGDVYGYLLVATGRVDIMIDPILNVWDAAAVQPIIEEAGGRFSDWAGKATIHAGESIGTNGWIHDQVLAVTRSRAGQF